VTVLPATMKKSRPGHLVKVIAKPADVQSVARALAEETGTLGVRETSADHRWVAERRFETVELAFGGESGGGEGDGGSETHEVTVKVASDDAGAVYDVSAEYDDCEAVAGLVDLPTREVMRRAEAAVHEDLGSGDPE
jgi:uncharacterized protein (DUF111 family)